MSLGVFITLCFTLMLVWVLSQFSSNFYEFKAIQSRNMVRITVSLLSEYEARIKAGEFDRLEGQKRALQRIKNLRYNDDDYFWINDLGPKMVMHPFNPALDGKDLSDYKDSNGKKVFMEFVKVCQEKEEGYVDYMWPKPGQTKPDPKISYVKLFKPWGWIIGTGVYVNDMKSDQEKKMAKIYYVTLFLVIIIGFGGLLLSYLMARSIAKPIHRTVEGILEGADQVAGASSQISSTSQSLAEGASEQAAGLEETSSSIAEMTSMTKQNADNSNEANALMLETTTVMSEANQAMKELTQSMNEITIASEETGKIIKTIDEIAFQTNLLALNAAVEAARAGEAGAGFAVVADEVRNLALRAAEAAKNTSNLIEETVKKIRAGSNIVERTNQAFTKAASGSKKIADLVGEITVASYEQAQGIEQINKAISEMDRVVQLNAANAEESASAAEEMNAQAEQMKDYVEELVSVIRGNGNESRPPLKAISGPEKKRKVLALDRRGNPKLGPPRRPDKRSGRTAIPDRFQEVHPDQVFPLDEK